jgi:ferrochelatase
MNGKKAVLLLNLGSPDSFSVPDVRRYLNEFLMDEKVIDVPLWWRTILVKGLIVPFRAPKSAKAYSSIWEKEGSPLVNISSKFVAAVQQQLNMPVALGMRYGNPTPTAALKKLKETSGAVEELLVAPMYPHYAMSSYETALEHALKAIKETYPAVKLKVLKPFHSEPAYIQAMAESIKPFLKETDFDAVLFSYHGLPIRHLQKSDTTGSHCYSSGECCEIKSLAWNTCYKHQVKATTALVAENLKLDKNKVVITFQSRLGSDKWIQPFTDVELAELPKRGVKKLLVLCPAFVADCLETLEEMDDRGKEIFMSNGGELFKRVPCLNTDAEWVNAFAAWCSEYDSRYKHLWN